MSSSTPSTNAPNNLLAEICNVQQDGLQCVGFLRRRSLLPKHGEVIWKTGFSSESRHLNRLERRFAQALAIGLGDREDLWEFGIGIHPSAFYPTRYALCGRIAEQTLWTECSEL